jgi:hypothetical protein
VLIISTLIFADTAIRAQCQDLNEEDTVEQLND